MRIPVKKLINGFEIPVLGFGTWEIGGEWIKNPDNDDKTDIIAIKNAIDTGITHLDTAESYSAGHAEKLVGQAIKDYDRSKLFLTSKVSPSHFHYKDVITSAKNSLSRLKTDYLDLYLLHSPSVNIPIQETMKAMDELVDKGLIKNIGVSNFNIERLKEAQKCSKHQIAVNQIHYNLIFREIEKKGVLRYCQENNIMLIAYRPIQKGILAKSNSTVFNDICQKYNKTPSQIAINWLITQKNVVTICKMENMKHLLENLGAIGWVMKKEDLEKLRNEFPNQQDISDVVPLI